MEQTLSSIQDEVQHEKKIIYWKKVGTFHFVSSSKINILIM